MATKLTKKQTKAVLSDAKKLRARDKAKAAERGKKLTLSKDFKPTVPARTPPKDTSKRPSSRAYANNRGVIDSLVEPEKVPVNNPSTMSGSRDSQRQAFKAAKTGISETYKLDAKGNKIPVSEEEFKKAAQKFVNAERKIPKGTSLNQVKATKLAGKEKAISDIAKVASKGLDNLSAAERKMAREGIAPPRAPSGAGATKAPVASATAPKAPAVAKTTKVTTAGTAPKMTRAERSAANKAAHAVKRAAEQAKWDAQKAAKTGKAPATAKPKTTAAKPAAKPAVKTTATKPATPAKPAVAKPAAPTKPVVSKPVVSKPATAKATPAPKTKPAPVSTGPSAEQLAKQGEARAVGVRERANNFRLNQATRAAQDRMAARAAASNQGWMARNLPNVSTVLKEGLISPVGRKAALEVGKNFGKGLLTRGNVAITALTYSPDAGPSLEQWKAENKARDVEWAARAARAGRSGPMSRGSAKGDLSTIAATSKKATLKPTAAPKKVAQVTRKSAATTPAKQQASPVMKASPEKAIADFEAKLRNAGVVSIAGGAGGKAQMVPQAMSVTQLEDQFKKKKGPR